MSLALKAQAAVIVAAIRACRVQQDKLHHDASEADFIDSCTPEQARNFLMDVGYDTEAKQKRLLKRIMAARNARRSIQSSQKGLFKTAARRTHLARMFLKGTPYEAVERDPHSPPKWSAVAGLIIRFGEVQPEVAEQRLRAWANEGKLGTIDVPSTKEQVQIGAY